MEMNPVFYETPLKKDDASLETVTKKVVVIHEIKNYIKKEKLRESSCSGGYYAWGPAFVFDPFQKKRTVVSKKEDSL